MAVRIDPREFDIVSPEFAPGKEGGYRRMDPGRLSRRIFKQDSFPRVDTYKEKRFTAHPVILFVFWFYLVEEYYIHSVLDRA